MTEPNLIMHSEQNPYRKNPLMPIEPELPILRAEDMGNPYRATPQSNISDLFEVYDYAIQAPVRAGVSEYQKSRDEGDFLPELRGFWGAAKQYFKKPSEAPMWSDIAESEGLSPLTFKEAAQQAGLQGLYPDISPADIGGFVGESVIDPLNLVGGGAALGAMKYADEGGNLLGKGVKKGGNLLGKGVKKGDDLIVHGNKGPQMSVGGSSPGKITKKQIEESGKPYIYHTSLPGPIKEIDPYGPFDDALFFSDEPYTPKLGSDKKVQYAREITDNDDFIDANLIFKHENSKELDDIVRDFMEEWELDEETAKALLSEKEDAYKLADDGIIKDYDLAGEIEWDAQKKTVKAAKKLGYSGALGEDEQGLVYMIPMFGKEKDLLEIID